MEVKRSCIIYITKEAKPSMGEVMRVFYIGKYIDKYSKVIDKDKVYPKAEAIEILNSNSTYGFKLSTRNESNLGRDMIEELAYLEERAELNFDALNWTTVDEYIKELVELGYTTEKLSEEEYAKWFEWKYQRSTVVNQK